MIVGQKVLRLHLAPFASAKPGRKISEIAKGIAFEIAGDTEDRVLIVAKIARRMIRQGREKVNCRPLPALQPSDLMDLVCASFL